MLMEAIKEEKEQEPIDNSNDAVIYIRNDPVMQSAIDVLTLLGNKKKIILRAVGDSIPNAVAVANIITEKMLRGNSKIENIKLDTENAAGIGKMTSNIEIVLIKI